MIACTSFRDRFTAATDDAELLEHVRACDACLEHAAEIDPDILFRAIGGAEMIPPGGVDAFVDDVMRQVRVRGTESTLRPHRVVSWPNRFAIAATVAAAFAGATFFYQQERAHTAPMPVAHVATAAVTPRQLTTKPVVETYDSKTATIVEVPTEGANDVKVVMVFDEKLPADL